MSTTLSTSSSSSSSPFTYLRALLGPTPAEAAALSKDKERISNVADTAMTNLSLSLLKQDFPSIISAVKSALDTNPDEAKALLNDIAENFEKKPEPTPFEKLKLGAFKALPEDLKPLFNDPNALFDKAIFELKLDLLIPATHYLVTSETFKALFHHLQLLHVTSPEIAAQLEDKAMLSLQQMPKISLLNGLTELLEMYVSRLEMSFKNESPEKPSDADNKKRLERYLTIYKGLTECHSKGTELPNEVEGPSFQEALYQTEQSLKKFIFKFEIFFHNLFSETPYIPTLFQDAKFNAEFYSTRFNSNIATFNEALGKIQSDFSVSMINYQWIQDNSNLSREIIRESYFRVLGDLTPLGQEIIRPTRLALQKQEQDKSAVDLPKLLERITLYIEMENFLVNIINQLQPSENKLLSEATLLASNLAKQPILTDAERIRFSLRTNQELKIVIERDIAEETKLSEAKTFITSHQNATLALNTVLDANEKEIGFLTRAYDAGGKDQRSYFFTRLVEDRVWASRITPKEGTVVPHLQTLSSKKV